MKSLRNLFFYPLFLLILSCIFSCAYQEVEILGLENAVVKKISSKGVEAEIYIKIKNPNNFSISIVDSDLEVIINGNPLGKAKISDKITLPKKSEITHRILIESEFEKSNSGMIATFASILLTKSLRLGVKGDITARSMFIMKVIKVDFNENVEYSSK